MLAAIAHLPNTGIREVPVVADPLQASLELRNRGIAVP